MNAAASAIAQACTKENPMPNSDSAHNPSGTMDSQMRLMDRRKALGLRQEDLAVRLGLSRNAYGEYERGHSKMTLDLIKSLAGILTCSPGWLAFGEGPAPVAERP
jgi:DNA-binding XRE family transcriptional regulator